MWGNVIFDTTGSYILILVPMSSITLYLSVCVCVCIACAFSHTRIQIILSNIRAYFHASWLRACVCERVYSYCTVLCCERYARLWRMRHISSVEWMKETTVCSTQHRQNTCHYHQLTPIEFCITSSTPIVTHMPIESHCIHTFGAIPFSFFLLSLFFRTEQLLNRMMHPPNGEIYEIFRYLATLQEW